MNVYLIGNNSNLKNEKIDSLKLNSNDIVVLFNHQYPLKWDKIKKHKNKLVFLRYTTWSGKKYSGYEIAIKNEYNKIIFLGNKEFYENFKSNNTEYFYIIPTNYTIDKSPTSGFMAFNYIKNKYPSANIIIVGFDEKINKNGHDYMYEYKYYEKNNITLI